LLLRWCQPVAGFTVKRDKLIIENTLTDFVGCALGDYVILYELALSALLLII
jgi:hypothetical protein